MPTAKKLPSGSWRCRVFSHIEYVDGKKKNIYESFTVKDPSLRGKKECERMAAEWAFNRQNRAALMTVHDACRRYIDTKREVLSPSTVRGYEAILKNYVSDIEGIHLRELTSDQLQLWISDLTRKHSAKSVRNTWGLVRASLDMFDAGTFKVTLPSKEAADLYTPTDDDIRRLLDVTNKDPELHLCIMLAAFGSLRRSEACAVTMDDFSNDGVSITKALVQDADNFWVLKDPKTKKSRRFADLPSFVVKYARTMTPDKDGRLIHVTPGAIQRRFQRAVVRAGLQHIRYHDLRHYYVSISHALNIPEEYTMQNGGWVHESRAMKEIYRDKISDIDRVNRKKLRDHFQLISHEIRHDIKKKA